MSPWQLTLEVPADTFAVSSHRCFREPKARGGNRSRAKPLPSYLVAFAVGPFDSSMPATRAGVPLRVVTPRGQAAQAAWAVQSTLPRPCRRVLRHAVSRLDGGGFRMWCSSVPGIGDDHVRAIDHLQKEGGVDHRHRNGTRRSAF